MGPYLKKNGNDPLLKYWPWKMSIFMNLVP